MCDKTHRGTYMIRQDKKSFHLKLIILAAVCMVMVVFSLSWYHALTSIDCALSKDEQAGVVKVDSLEGKINDCNVQLHFHWIKFIGINGLIYGATALAFVASVMKRKRY